MIKRILLTTLFITSASATYAEEFHCRITKAQDYDTKIIVNSKPDPTNKEFIVEANIETNIYFSGDVEYALSGYKGSRVSGTNNYTQPFIVISKLDNKFFDMYLRYKYGGNSYLVSGICKET
jgi:hypothetical protein